MQFGVDPDIYMANILSFISKEMLLFFFFLSGCKTYIQ